ncbi:(2Fe-2S)-binding protein [Candidatus Uabimicrobium amorphum]|uniref:(2Fe-2S)-binding protein n=1 Tax=Uabimicrobium amorphum TaxID=2596890 RepID=A0A5S9F3J0_UABAM|nr:(2Fe-2S)-binding protein [Candidatus Uabimicrobium amorphum]BBM84548.1 (2Fe-2S)-binding protein [Candidatus Uabimicrobium amorphum]
MEEKKNLSQKEISRRSFLKGAGIASVGAVIATTASVDIKADTKNDSDVIGKNGISCEFDVNGKKYAQKVPPRTTLAELLREDLNLTGTKVVCDRGACGACTVIVDGKSVCSCMTLAIDSAGKKIETIEGLANGDELHPLQEAFVNHDALQCGFCTPGMVMSCKNLLDHNAQPTLPEVRKAVSGNLCRCGTYPHVFKAVMDVSGKKGE